MYLCDDGLARPVAADTLAELGRAAQLVSQSLTDISLEPVAREAVRVVAGRLDPVAAAAGRVARRSEPHRGPAAPRGRPADGDRHVRGRSPRLRAAHLRASAGRDRAPRHGELAEATAGLLLHRPSRSLQSRERGLPPLHRAERSRTRRRAPTPRPARVSRACTGSPGTLWWISALGSRSAAIDGCSSPVSRSEIVSVRGAASGPIATHVQMRPSSSHVPSTSSPSGARREAMLRHAAGTSASEYCRRTFIARITVGARGAGTSKPPSAKDTRDAGENVVVPASTSASCVRARATRPGSISRPSTSTSGRVRARRAYSSREVTALAPKPRSTTSGSSARRSDGMPRDPPVDAAKPIRAGRATRDLADGGAAVAHEPMMPGSRPGSGGRSELPLIAIMGP